MSSAWLLPEHLADVLPHEARQIEELRRIMLDAARGYGFELVMPPLLEHLESLLSGTGHALDLQTFKLVDQLSGRSLGVRADSTPQVARIDAHLLNRQGVSRLCYCGPVLHTRPADPYATREPLQFGAEIYGHAGLEADLEAQELAVTCLQRAGVAGLMIDLADARILRGLLDGVEMSADHVAALHVAILAKDAATVQTLGAGLPAELNQALASLLRLYGGEEVLDLAQHCLPAHPLILAALRDLRWLAKHVRDSFPTLRVGFDLSDLSGYAYYTGSRFAIYAAGRSNCLVRGGRYDDVGAVFGRRRAAVGFSLDLKTVVSHRKVESPRSAVCAPWGEEPALRAAVLGLRERGETVVCVLPGHEHELDEFDCDRELVNVQDRWVVRTR